MKARWFKGVVKSSIVILMLMAAVVVVAAPVKIVYWRALTGAAGDAQV